MAAEVKRNSRVRFGSGDAVAFVLCNSSFGFQSREVRTTHVSVCPGPLCAKPLNLLLDNLADRSSRVDSWPALLQWNFLGFQSL